MADFIWDERYSVGIAEIDEHHKQLLKLINMLSAELETDCVQKPSALVQCLLSLCIARFPNEERLMAEKSYPDLMLHKSEHDELIRTVTAAQESSDPGTKFLMFLRTWTQHHFKISTPGFKVFLQQKRRNNKL